MIAACACLLLLYACGSGSSSTDPDPWPKPDPTPDPPDPGTVYVTFEGTVQDATGAPLPAVQVLLGLNPLTTDASGHFEYGKLLPGNYKLSMQDQLGNFDCREVTLYDGSGPFTFLLPSGGVMLHATHVSPALNSDSAALDSDLAIEFSAPLAAEPVNPAAISISPGIGDYEVAVDGSTLVIHPTLQLPLNQIILIEIDDGITAADTTTLGQPLRWRFRTSGADLYPPRIIGTNLPSSWQDFPPNSALRIEYNEAVAVPDSGFSLTVQPEVQLSAAASGRNLVITAAGGWAIETTYTVEYSGVADSAGNPSSELVSYTFATGDQPASQHNVNPDWNREADVIVFSADPAGSYDVYSIRPDGTELTQLSFLAGDELQPSLSYNGQLLAYQHRDGRGNWSIYIQDVALTTDPVQLTAEDFNDYDPFFSRTTSDQIIYVSDLAQPVGLYLMNSDGSSPTEQDRDFGSSQIQPALHPLLDTQMLFTGSSGGDQDIWRKTVSAIDGSAINQNLTVDMLSNEHHSAWGPDASYFVFVSDFAGIDNLWYAEATGEYARQVTYLDTAVRDVCISPFAGDQQAVLCIQTADDSSDLAIISLTSGEIELYLTGEEAGNQ